MIHRIPLAVRVLFHSCGRKPAEPFRRLPPAAISFVSIAILSTVAAVVAVAADEPPQRPRVAVFPLAGSADPDVRDRCAYSMRIKLDRDGAYEPIDGPAMADLAANAAAPITFDTPADTVEGLAAPEHPTVLIWGEINALQGKTGRLRIQILDLRDQPRHLRPIERDIDQPTDLRFVVEDILMTLPGVKPFAHPQEQAVHHDAPSDAAWAKNPNLLVDGDFSREGHWQPMYMPGQTELSFGAAPPATADHAVIVRSDGAVGVLAMSLSAQAADADGLACVSEAIAIDPAARYRLQFQFKSDGPDQRVFVSGFAVGRGLAGQSELREVYRRQVPASGATGGKWATIECDVNPHNAEFPVQYVKIELAIYRRPGAAMFRDVQFKAVGRQITATTQSAQ